MGMATYSPIAALRPATPANASALALSGEHHRDADSEDVPRLWLHAGKVSGSVNDSQDENARRLHPIDDPVAAEQQFANALTFGFRHCPPA